MLDTIIAFAQDLGDKLFSLPGLTGIAMVAAMISYHHYEKRKHDFTESHIWQSARYENHLVKMALKFQQELVWERLREARYRMRRARKRLDDRISWPQIVITGYSEDDAPEETPHDNH